MYILILLITLLILFFVYFIFFLMSFKVMMEGESLTSYECGFDLISWTRNLFSYRFFLISILFLIFDVEIALMLPIPYYSGIMMSLGFIIFISILILGLLYEYNYGMLEWL